MKKILLASIVLTLLFVGIYATNSEAQTRNQRAMQGQVVSLADVIRGERNLQLTRERATELLENGSPLVFLHNKKIHFVQNDDGSFAFRRLSNFAHNKNVRITGTARTVSGINVIIMSNIESMD